MYHQHTYFLWFMVALTVSCFPKLKCGGQGQSLFEIVRAHRGLLTTLWGRPVGESDPLIFWA